MKALITGASSLPGYRTALSLLRRGFFVFALHFSHDVPISDANLVKIRVDVRNFNEVKKVFEKYKPDVTIHMAAYGDVDGCERDKKLAWDVNVCGTVNVTRLANKFSDFLLYLSTDYVFDGLRGNYGENEVPNPINFYGLTKLCGEVSALSSNVSNAIVRASSIYGLGPGRKNFAKFLIEKLSKRERVKALIDQYTTPTQASLLGEAIAEILERRLCGIFHVVGEKLSRYEFALKVAEKLGFDKTLIKPAKMEEMRWITRRPKDSSLNCEETQKRLKTDFYPTEHVLETLKKEYEEETRR